MCADRAGRERKEQSQPDERGGSRREYEATDRGDRDGPAGARDGGVRRRRRLRRRRRRRHVRRRAERQDRRPPPRFEVFGPVGDGGPALLRAGVRGRRPLEGRLHHQQRRGRSRDPAQPGRAGDHVGRKGHPARQPRSGQRRGHHRRRQVAGREDDRLRPPDRRRRRRLLRLRRRDRGRAATGQGLDRGPQGQGFPADRDPLRGPHGFVRHRSQERQHRDPQEQRTSTSLPSRPCRTGTARRR